MKYTPEDFAGLIWTDASGGSHHISEVDAIDIALVANKKLNEYITSLPTVYCRTDDGLWACDEHEGFARATHLGKLIIFSTRSDK